MFVSHSRLQPNLWGKPTKLFQTIQLYSRCCSPQNKHLATWARLGFTKFKLIEPGLNWTHLIKIYFSLCTVNKFRERLQLVGTRSVPQCSSGLVPRSLVPEAKKRGPRRQVLGARDHRHRDSELPRTRRGGGGRLHCFQLSGRQQAVVAAALGLLPCRRRRRGRRSRSGPPETWVGCSKEDLENYLGNKCEELKLQRSRATHSVFKETKRYSFPSIKRYKIWRLWFILLAPCAVYTVQNMYCNLKY